MLITHLTTSQLDLENPPDLQLVLLDGKKKSAGFVHVQLKTFGLTNKAIEKELDLKTGTNAASPGFVRVRLSLGTGPPLKQSKKKVATTKTKSGTGKSKSSDDIFTFIKNQDAIGLETYLLSCDPADVNQTLPRSGNTPLHEALLDRAEECATLLLKYDGIEIDIRNASDNTPLHYFCEKWQSPSYAENFKIFIAKGADKDAVNQNGETPLFKSIFNNVIRTLLMESLIEVGADANTVNDRGDGVLHYAVHLGRADLVNLILRASPRLDLRGAAGKTPLELSREYHRTKIAQHLKDMGELFHFLEENDLDDYKAWCIRNEISLPLLSDLTEESLLSMGIESWGVRRKILNAAAKVRNLLSKEEIERLKKKEDTVPEKDLEDLERELNEIRGESDDFIINHRDLEYVMLLGSGASGDVYKGLYGGQPVAIKRLKEMAPAEEVEEFKKEFEILAKVRHPNVVFFFGASTQPVLAMVMEYCARGSLFHAMKDARFDINWGRAISICQEMTAGLICLHSHKIFHRDLKSLNLLVTQQWHIKLADFGLSRFDTKENMETMKQMRGTFAYVDPAVYNGGAFTAASDVYSLGIIVWEIVNRVVTGKYAQPYSEYKQIQFDFQVFPRNYIFSYPL